MLKFGFFPPAAVIDETEIFYKPVTRLPLGHSIYLRFSCTQLADAFGVDGVSLTNCLFKDNHLVDDMLHVVYSSIVIDNCRFVNARYDALDLDMSEVQLTNSQFTGSGNDGVDLMGSFAYLKHNGIFNSGDKAVSVGERSMLYMTDNKITSNQIGVES